MADGIHVIGIDHHRSPIDLRERMAVGPGDLQGLLADLCEHPGVTEAVALSTCNRCEFYLGGSIDLNAVIGMLAQRQGVLVDDLRSHCYDLDGRDAVRHLFRVVASLESMVIGEYQIMHQTRIAYEQARLHRHTGNLLNPVFQRALAAGKEVRNATGIGRYKLSMASIAVDLAEHIHGKLKKKRLLVIGAGEMAELALRHFVDNGIATVSLVNRTRERALELSNDAHGGANISVRHWSDLGDILGEHDIIVSSTAASHAVITPEAARAALRQRRGAMMYIDLAVPRDVDPAVGDIDEAYLYNVDHLEQVVAANQQLRVDEIDAAAALIDERVSETLQATNRDRGQLRGEVARFFDQVVDEEAERLARKLPLGNDDRGQVRYGLKRVGNKLQHRLLQWLRDHEDDPEAESIVRELLELD
ncbi:MAG: glutamyl-tRNA reductase [Planctomycetota bacterium]|jgi:glutamyl-tRNA reductase|nr:glutamyl-tRNA reductase [Planctomycetota bacterium]